MAYSILLKLKDRGLKMHINGTSRCQKYCVEKKKGIGKGQSDHLYVKETGDYSGRDSRGLFAPNKYRETHKGHDANGTERLLSNLGCAIDFQGGVDSRGVKQRSTVGIQIFQLLASEYKNCIRQLIWELAIPRKKVSEGTVTVTDTSADTVGTCVHVSSYGSGATTPQIFVAYNSEGNSIPFKEDENGKPNLPPTFMRILRDMAINNQLDDVILNNWTTYKLAKPTKEQLITWCKNLGIPDY
jgi:hypothetical protein